MVTKESVAAGDLANLGLGEVIAAAADALKKSANLSDVTNASKSLSNIGGFASKGDLGTINLNALGDRATSAGVWYQPTDILATSAANYPIQSSGTLLVTQSAYGCQQEYTAYSGRKFVRGLSSAWTGSGPWASWVEFYGPNNKPTSNDIGSLAKISNLSDVTNPSLSLTNIGGLAKISNLSDIANPSLALSNLSGFPIKGSLGTSDLNGFGNITSSVGVWYQSVDSQATPGRHYPANTSGTLLVTQSAYGCQQEYTTYSGLKFVRGLTAEWNGAGPWSEWKQISAQQPKTVTTRDYIRIPDVPGGLIIQWFAGPSSTGESTMGPLSFPIAFPTACVFSSVSTLGNGTGSCDQMFQVTSTNLNSITLFSQVFGSGSVPGTANPLVFAIGY
ncbi:hypothetical protein PL78_03585 [Yersinia entomophaga]|uniref:Putative tail fiber protein gp53-like C-terminal domain-containing protein n=1 Tax=Yersinia entomophaga TaxID=935293 RepID=A0ABN4PNR8_YERET|nr:hypothetical protein PL78_03585 [Yersinia entomophaga]